MLDSLLIRRRSAEEQLHLARSAPCAESTVPGLERSLAEARREVEEAGALMDVTERDDRFAPL